MKHAGLLVLAICLLVPTPAEARKRCRPADPAAAAEAPDADASVSAQNWARGNDSSWLHSGTSSWHHDVDDSWHHGGTEDVAAPAPVESVAYDPKEGAGWVHETDYGWWAGVPEAALNEAENQDDRFLPDEEDCTVSKDRNECVVLANQFAIYRFRLGLAIERGDETWAQSLELTLARLDARAEFMGCPWAIQPTLGEQIVATVKTVVEAAVVAARVYSMFQRMGL